MTRTIILAIASTALVSGCVNSTRLVATWTDPTATPIHLTRTLAVYMSKEEGMRRMVEDKLAARLPGGVPSYRIIPDEEVSNIDAVRQRVASGGFDGAVVMRLVGVNTEVVGTIPRDFYGYWNYWGYAGDPAYYTTEKLYSVESSLYSFADGRMIWMGRSETVNPKNANKLAEYAVNFAANNIKRSGFIK